MSKKLGLRRAEKMRDDLVEMERRISESFTKLEKTRDDILFRTTNTRSSKALLAKMDAMKFRTFAKYTELFFAINDMNRHINFLKCNK
jgi:hypothetical protein